MTRGLCRLGAWTQVAVLLACAPQDTPPLGRLRDAGADASDGAPDERDTATAECTDDRGCASDLRPFCNSILRRCVECLGDSDCGHEQECRERSGECFERPDSEH